MKPIKILAFSFLFLPLAASAQSKGGQASSAKPKTAAVTTVNTKYPLYSDEEAAKLWQMWLKKATFTQNDYMRVIELCDASFYYLTIELQNIIDTTTSQKKRNEMALQLDMGITSNMANFARTFALRMQTLGQQGALAQENMTKLVEMLTKKKKYRETNQEVFHPKK